MKRSPAYFRAKRKVEILKGFYQHLISFVVINTVLILWFAQVFSPEKTNFSDIWIYTTTFLWGVGLFFHGVYVFVEFHLKNNLLKRWEERKIQELMEDDDF